MMQKNKNLTFTKVSLSIAASVSFLISFCLLLNGDASAKDNISPTPEFKDKPAYYDKSNNSLIELEKAQYKPMQKLKAFGFGGGVAGYHLNGVTSPVRIKSKPDLVFVIKVTPGTDPTSIIDLLAFTIEDNQRIFITTKSSAFNGSKADFEKIPYRVNKSSDGVYLISASGLKPGEYFFGGSEFMFAFGIDEQ